MSENIIMKSGIKKSGLICKTCGYELLVIEDKVICQHCKIGKRFKQVHPKSYSEVKTMAEDESEDKPAEDKPAEEKKEEAAPEEEKKEETTEGTEEKKEKTTEEKKEEDKPAA